MQNLQNAIKNGSHWQRQERRTKCLSVSRVMDFKKKIEARDECLIDTSPTRLRNGKLLYYNHSRINKFMNDASYLIHTVRSETTKVKKFCDLIFHY